MARPRPKRKPSRAIAWRVIAVILVVAGVLGYHFLGPQLRYRLGFTGAPLPHKDDGIRVVTWNLRHFGGSRSKHDVVRLKTEIEALDADILALQEIEDPEALRRLLPGWEVAVSDRGGRGRQKLAIAWDPDRITALGEPIEHRSLSMKGRVRPGFSLRLVARDTGLSLHVFVVHLKAMPEGHELRAQQWELLLDALESLARDDDDMIVLGDFNVTGPEGGHAATELASLESTLARGGLTPVEVLGQCTAYWDGPRRDAWKEPSLLDLVFVRGLGEPDQFPSRAYPAGHCMQHACEAFRSTDAYPDLDFERVSDHCPVVVDLPPAAPRAKTP